MNTRLIFFRITRYLKYLFMSVNRNGHGIHSPFVFDIISRVFRNKTDPEIVNRIEKVRKSLLRDKRVIEIQDFGTGQEKGQNNLKEVSVIAKKSSVPERYGKLLANMAEEFGEPLIIEFGTSFGISTMYMAASCGETPVYSMEGSPATAEIAESNFRDAGLTNIRLYNWCFRGNTFPGSSVRGEGPDLYS